MKIAFFDVEEHQIPMITQRCKEVGLDLVKISQNPFDYANIADIQGIDILSVFLSCVNAQAIQSLPNLKLISVRASGIDAIDVTAAQQKKVTVINVPSYGSDTVAEYAITLLLMLARRLTTSFMQCKEGIFNQKKTRGNDVAGKTLGVIGTGQIGRKLVKIAHGFDMNIICYDTKPSQEMCSKYNARYVSLEELFKTADLISIHLPYTPQTHHLVNFETLPLLKPGVLLVNTSRGAIVDISALRKGLQENIFGGVALDTFEGEDIWIYEETILDDCNLPSAEKFKKGLESFYLLQFENVILTPHNAFNSHEAMQRIIETALADIINFSQNGIMHNAVS